MKIAVMQPYLFPYIGYFQLINAADRFVIFDDVNFINKGRINRNYILVNKEKHLFTLSLKRSGQNKLIKDIEINDPAEWRSDFLKTIEMSYKNSENFRETFDVVSQILGSQEINISAFILNSLKVITEHLNIKTDLINSSSKYQNTELKGQDRIIDICKKENAGEYINLPGGMGLYSPTVFNSNGIKLKFIKPGKISYKQFGENFIDSLSIIDILMFNSREKVREYLDRYELV